MKALRYFFAFSSLFLLATTILFPKSSYRDGNYSEAGGCTRMCMRCHMGSLNPKGLVLNIQSDKMTIKGGDTITITATISGFSKDWSPGLALMADRYSQYTSQMPQEYGWEIITNSNGKPYNFFKIKDMNDSVFFWKLKAPNYPGIYRLAVSGYFSDMSTGVPVQGTKRGDNSLAITVNKGNDSLPKMSEKPVSAYRNFFILRFPVPLDSSRVMAHKTGKIRKIDDTTDLNINNIWQSRDNRTVIIKTEQQMYPQYSYSWFYVNLSDYSTVPKSYTGNLIANSNTEPYKIYAEYTQDVTSKEIKQHDRTEYLGNNADEIHRINLVFFLPDNPIDLLPVEKITKATLCLTPKIISKSSPNQDVWTVTKLLPGTNWYDYVGSNQTVETNWSGYNPVSPPISSITHDVPAVLDTSLKGKWRWDITKDFVKRFKKLGGSGTNTANYILRIQAQNESSSSGGIGFYGSDADSVSNMPYIELELDQQMNSIEYIRTSFDELFISPNPATDFLEISYPPSIKRGLGGVSIEIFSVLGEKVISTPFPVNLTPTLSMLGEGVRIDVTSLPQGLYFVKVGDRVNKFIKN